jgi:Tfp pilus assembly protein PilN
MTVSPNLARRPFVNQRPVQRVALLLAVAGLVLLIVNLWLFVGYARTRGANATQLRLIEERIEVEAERLAAADRQLAAADLGLQNGLVDYLNRRIDERTFGWSVLFDRLAGLLPDDVRLKALAPSFSAAQEPTRNPAARRAGAAAEPPVELSLQGTARDGEALLELVDALFADPAFSDPNLSQESTTQQGELSFSLTVAYHSRTAEALATEAADGRRTGAAADEDDGEQDGDEAGDDGDGAEVTT